MANVNSSPWIVSFWILVAEVRYCVRKPSLIARWTALGTVLFFVLFVIGCGGHTTAVTPPTTATPQTILFTSSRALDGSDAANHTRNLWTINEDGTGAKPLTRLTSLIGLLQAVWSPDGRKIAFSSQRALDGSDASEPNWNIWVMNADGTGATPLTELAAADSMSPAWSPDGTKIAFESSGALDGSDAGNPAGNLWVMNADGTGRTPITKLTSTYCVSPVWSPNGHSVAFVSMRALDGSDNLGGIFNIWSINVDGTGATPLTKLTVWSVSALNPAWSPDGTKVAYISQRALDGSDALGGSLNIWVVTADATSTKPLTEFSLVEVITYMTWSPDGKKIAYVSDRKVGPNQIFPMANIFVMDADGFGIEPLTRLTAEGAGSSSPSWSPDGQKIVFDSLRALDGSDAAGPTSNIWIMNADGTGARPLTNLTNPQAYNGDPQFRP